MVVAENKCAWSVLVLLLPYLKLWPQPAGLYGDPGGVVSTDCHISVTSQHGASGNIKVS